MLDLDPLLKDLHILSWNLDTKYSPEGVRVALLSYEPGPGYLPSLASGKRADLGGAKVVPWEFLYFDTWRFPLGVMVT